MSNSSGITRERSDRPCRCECVAVAACAVTLVLALAPAGATAGEGWNVNVDLALIHQNTYLGSDEQVVTGLPAVEVTRDLGAYTWFVSLPWRGVGVSHVDRRSGLAASLSANFGSERDPDEYSLSGIPVDHSERTRAFLADSPTVSTPVVVEATLEYPTPYGILGATLGYHPTSVDDPATGNGVQTRHGVLATLRHVVPLHVSGRLTVVGIAGVEFMDQAYADAWFSVDHATARLASFDAGAGLRDVQAALHASYQASDRMAVSLYCSGLYLMGDAADSPFTRDRKQQTVVLRTSYTF